MIDHLAGNLSYRIDEKQWQADNNNRPMILHTTRPKLPRPVTARLFRPSRSVTTSARVASRPWRLVFERRTPPFIEPLMGYTGSDDTLTQVELNFPTREAAIAYARRLKLDYVVQDSPPEGQPVMNRMTRIVRGRW
ncbi:NADH dehydrogenase ubiquinone Fe-S protein 4 [Mesorhizobium carmichaelinearum]|uniref:NADH dehydrogenase ubiquinone Fe-S protein 4 n=1 Tax=Mesorhizobium carmichaelinearum TaxID=1208188 RepID=UPI0015CDE9B6|nr:NADH dehydrogenase ubiquinone Fe-S protein 4 [Mesorhizobium carmichaelinearum]